MTCHDWEQLTIQSEFDRFLNDRIFCISPITDSVLFHQQIIHEAIVDQSECTRGWRAKA